MAPPPGSAPIIHDPEHRVADYERLIAAFSGALETMFNRRDRDLVQVVLTAQQEHLALVTQAIANQSQDHGQALDHMIVRLAEEMAPSSVVKVSEVFRESAARIDTAVRSGSHFSGKHLQKQDAILEELREVRGALGEIRAFLGEAVTHLSELAHQRGPGRERERHLHLAVAPSADVLNRLGDEHDDE